MEWIENLPERCPPTEAVEPSGQTFYRLGNNNPPQEKDFLSWQASNIGKQSKFGECIAKSLSLWSNADSCLKIRKLPLHKEEKYLIRITLDRGDGLIENTFKANHYSWWRSRAYDITTAEAVNI